MRGERQSSQILLCTHRFSTSWHISTFWQCQSGVRLCVSGGVQQMLSKQGRRGHPSRSLLETADLRWAHGVRHCAATHAFGSQCLIGIRWQSTSSYLGSHMCAWSSGCCLKPTRTEVSITASTDAYRISPLPFWLFSSRMHQLLWRAIADRRLQVKFRNKLCHRF